MSINSSSRKAILFMIIPFLCFVIFFNFIPMVYMIVLGFFDYNLRNPNLFDFIGFSNFIKAFVNDRYREAVLRTIIFMVAPMIIQLTLGTTLAFFIYKARKILKSLFRSLIIIPMLIPPVVAGMTWRILFMPTFGGINYYFSVIGLPTPDWLGSTFMAPLSIIIANSWQWMPFITLLILAALESLPSEPFDVAKVDGANSLQVLFYITLPLLKPTLFVAVVFRLIDGLKVFAYVYSITNGGPGTATEDIGFLTYIMAFRYFEISYAAALSTTILMIAFFMTGILLKFNKILGGGLFDEN